MSLLDSMLLEGYRDPREVWIALRSDGAKGSGTIDDPYDGDTRQGPPIDAQLTCKRAEFIVGTQWEHGLSSADIGEDVTITGVRGPGEEWFNGTFALKAIVSPIHFALEFAPESGLPSAPPNVESSGFDFIEVTYPTHSGNKNALPAIARIYWPVAKISATGNLALPTFGSALIEDVSTDDFEGNYAALGPGDSGTSFRYRLRFLPSADVTTPLSCHVRNVIHRFDEVMRGTLANSVIHIGPGTFETRGAAPVYIADPSDWTQLHVGFIIRPAQRILGAGLGTSVLKLTLPVDEINETAAIATFLNVFPNVDHAQVADLTIDCNAPGHAAPYSVFPAPFTCGAVVLAGSFMTLRRVRAVHFCTQARAECFVLGLGPGAGGSAPVFNVIEDCIVEQPGENNTHETTLLTNVGNFYGNGRSPIVRHNYTDCTFPDGVSSEVVAIEAITTPTASNQEFTVTTKRPHNRIAGQNVLLNSVYGDSQYNTSHPYFNGPFKIKALDAVAPLTKFKCEFLYQPSDFPDPFPNAYFNPNFPPFIGVDFHGPTAVSGTGCVTEGNSIFDCLNCFYTDTGSSRDVAVRDNYYSNAGLGVFMNFPPAVFDAFQGASAIVAENAPEDSGFKHGVFTTIQPHGLSVNDTVTIREAGSSGPDGNNPYHGTSLLVKVIRSANQFVYRLTNQSALPGFNCQGRPVFASSLSISTLSFVESTGVVTVVTGSAHGLATEDFVTISDVDYNGFDGFFGGLFGPVTPDSVDANKLTFTVLDPKLQPEHPSGIGGILDRHVAAGITRNGSVATITTALAHGYFPGQIIQVRNAYVNSTTTNRYNGVVAIKPLTDKTFSYDMKAGAEPDPTLSKSPTGLAEYAAHWDIRHFVLENNIYDLYATDNNTAVLPRGASMFGLLQVDIPPYLFPVFVYRGNVIRHINGKVPIGTAQPSYGVFATTVGGGMAEQNIIDVSAAHPLTFPFSVKLGHLENKTSAGAPIHGVNQKPDQSIERIDDLESRIADALAMALI